LNLRGAGTDQIIPMPMQTAQSANDVLGPERGIQQPKPVQLTQPLAVLHISLDLLARAEHDGR
jgi:hypothetical protein